MGRYHCRLIANGWQALEAKRAAAHEADEQTD
jgi:hypothetical protein